VREEQELATGPCCRGSGEHPGLLSTESCQRAKGGDTSGMRGPALGSLVPGRHRHARVNPASGHKDKGGTGASVIQASCSALGREVGLEDIQRSLPTQLFWDSEIIQDKVRQINIFILKNPPSLLFLSHSLITGVKQLFFNLIQIES